MVLQYLLSEEVQKIDKKFYLGYKFKYWLYKLSYISLILETPDIVMDELLEDTLLQGDEPEEILQVMKVELIFTFFHSTEALLSLMLSLIRKKDLPLWIYMVDIRFKDLIVFVRENIVKKDFRRI